MLEIIETETAEESRCRLIQEMMSGSAATDEEANDRFGEILGLLDELEAGINEG